jgi:hypothetical protein
MPVWIVILEGEAEFGHHAALFDEAAKAESFYRSQFEIVLEDCTCVAAGVGASKSVFAGQPTRRSATPAGSSEVLSGQIPSPQPPNKPSVDLA